jgi:hypothetical protein
MEHYLVFLGFLIFTLACPASLGTLIVVPRYSEAVLHSPSVHVLHSIILPNHRQMSRTYGCGRLCNGLGFCLSLSHFLTHTNILGNHGGQK